MTPLDRFEEKYVVVPSACWIWVGPRDSKGYGSISVTISLRKKKVYSAHRFAYESFVGPIPDGLTIDHLCREKACVNWRHLEVVTNAENIRRAWTPKSTCPRGHDRQPGTGTVCRICERARNKLARERDPELYRARGRANMARYRAKKKAALTAAANSEL